MFANGETVTLHKPGTIVRDRYGDETEVGGQDIELYGVAVAPGQTQETTDGTGTTIASVLTLYTNEYVEVGAHDKVTVRGKKYEVIANTSGAWQNPFAGGPSGTVIELRNVYA